MLRITKQADYGILLLSRFAMGRGRLTYSARDLAAESGLGMPMVSKVLKLLAQAGLVESLRGVKGGYRLARDPGQITAGDIISALEGPVTVTECSTGESSDCQVESGCPVRGSWHLINVAIREALSRVTLAEMTCPVGDPMGAFGRGDAPERAPMTV